MPIFCILYTEKCKVFYIFIEKSVNDLYIYVKKCKVYMSSGLRATAKARFPHQRSLYAIFLRLLAAYMARYFPESDR